MATKVNIKHYRGDTYDADLTIDEYIPSENDAVKFGIKKKYDDDEYIIRKDIDPTTMRLHLEAEDTQSLKDTDYIYDAQVEFVDETGCKQVKTFLYGSFKLTKDVVRI